MKQEYFRHGDFHFRNGTSLEVANVINEALKANRRLRFWFGDTETGKAWVEENDVIGYIGRSSGTVQIPLAVFSRRSFGGGALMTQAIVRIDDMCKRRTLYAHPTFSTGEIEVHKMFRDINDYDNGTTYTHFLTIDRATHSRHTSFEQADRLRKFLVGELYNQHGRLKNEKNT